MTVIITHELILQIRDDAELTAMARVIEGAHRDAQWQGFGSDWDQARFSAYMLREAGFGLTADTPPDAARAEADDVHVIAPAQANDLAAVLPPLPRESYTAAADGLIGLGYRHNDSAQTLAVLNSHAFRQEDDGDGWNEPVSCAYSCSCGKAEYASWTQHDPGMTGLKEFQDEGLLSAMDAHHAHVAAMLHAGGPVNVVAAGPAVVTVTPEAVEAAANQLRSQTRDFASPDILVRKRARFVLLAAASRLGASTPER